MKKYHATSLLFFLLFSMNSMADDSLSNKIQTTSPAPGSSPQAISSNSTKEKDVTVTLVCPRKGCITIYGHNIEPKVCSDKGAEVEWVLHGMGDIYAGYIALTDDKGLCGCFKQNQRYVYGQDDSQKSIKINLNDFEWTTDCQGAAVCSTGYMCSQ